MFQHELTQSVIASDTVAVLSQDTLSKLYQVSPLELYMPGIENRLDTLISVTQLANTNGGWDTGLIAILIAGLALLTNAVLAYVGYRQHEIINQKELSFASGYTFVQVNRTPPEGTQLTEYVANYIRLFLRFTNTGDTAIDDVWIRFPDNLKIVVASSNGNNLDVRVLRLSEPLLPHKRKTFYFDEELFFQGNAELTSNTETSFRIAFKNPKEKQYSEIEVPFKVSRQVTNVGSTYKLSMDNAIKLDNGNIITLDEQDFNSLPRRKAT